MARTRIEEDEDLEIARKTIRGNQPLLGSARKPATKARPRGASAKLARPSASTRGDQAGGRPERLKLPSQRRLREPESSSEERTQLEENPQPVDTASEAVSGGQTGPTVTRTLNPDTNRVTFRSGASSASFDQNDQLKVRQGLGTSPTGGGTVSTVGAFNTAPRDFALAGSSPASRRLLAARDRAIDEGRINDVAFSQLDPQQKAFVGLRRSLVSEANQVPTLDNIGSIRAARERLANLDQLEAGLIDKRQEREAISRENTLDRANDLRTTLLTSLGSGRSDRRQREEFAFKDLRDQIDDAFTTVDEEGNQVVNPQATQRFRGFYETSFGLDPGEVEESMLNSDSRTLGNALDIFKLGESLAQAIPENTGFLGFGREDQPTFRSLQEILQAIGGLESEQDMFGDDLRLISPRTGDSVDVDFGDLPPRQRDLARRLARMKEEGKLDDVINDEDLTPKQLRQGLRR